MPTRNAVEVPLSNPTLLPSPTRAHNVGDGPSALSVPRNLTGYRGTFRRRSSYAPVGRPHRAEQDGEEGSKYARRALPCPRSYTARTCLTCLTWDVPHSHRDSQAGQKSSSDECLTPFEPLVPAIHARIVKKRAVLVQFAQLEGGSVQLASEQRSPLVIRHDRESGSKSRRDKEYVVKSQQP